MAAWSAATVVQSRSCPASRCRETARRCCPRRAVEKGHSLHRIAGAAGNHNLRKRREQPLQSLQSERFVVHEISAQRKIGFHISSTPPGRRCAPRSCAPRRVTSSCPRSPNSNSRRAERLPKPCSGEIVGQRKSRPVVNDFEHYTSVFHRARDLNRQPQRCCLRDHVLHGIFHQRLQRQRRNLASAQGVGHSDP